MGFVGITNEVGGYQLLDGGGRWHSRSLLRVLWDLFWMREHPERQRAFV
jgi:hypothetical protein